MGKAAITQGTPSWAQASHTKSPSFLALGSGESGDCRREEAVSTLIPALDLAFQGQETLGVRNFPNPDFSKHQLAGEGGGSRDLPGHHVCRAVPGAGARPHTLPSEPVAYPGAREAGGQGGREAQRGCRLSLGVKKDFLER